MTSWNTFTFQQPTSPTMEMTDCFHDFSMAILLFILAAFSIMLVSSLSTLYFNSSFSDHDLLELWWTIMPAVILILLAIPSLVLLYHYGLEVMSLFWIGLVSLLKGCWTSIPSLSLPC